MGEVNDLLAEQMEARIDVYWHWRGRRRAR
jgi:hypothetical protein